MAANDMKASAIELSRQTVLEEEHARSLFETHRQAQEDLNDVRDHRLPSDRQSAGEGEATPRVHCRGRTGGDGVRGEGEACRVGERHPRGGDLGARTESPPCARTPKWRSCIGRCCKPVWRGAGWRMWRFNDLVSSTFVEQGANDDETGPRAPLSSDV